MRWAYAHARALVAPSHEDYGLTPIEAGAWGKPTLALRAGGYLDTVAEGVSGLFFDAPTPEAIRAAVVAHRGPVLGRRGDPGRTWSSSPRPASRRGCSPRSLVCSTRG